MHRQNVLVCTRSTYARRTAVRHKNAAILSGMAVPGFSVLTLGPRKWRTIIVHNTPESTAFSMPPGDYALRALFSSLIPFWTLSGIGFLRVARYPPEGIQSNFPEPDLWDGSYRSATSRCE